MPPSAHAERTFNYTPNAHGAITQRQSTGFASRKLRVRIPFVPPIPKCPSLRMAMAEMPMSGARGCDQLAKRSPRWQMRGTEMTALCVYRNDCVYTGMSNLPNRSPTVHCARSCTLRQVPRSLPGRQGTTRKAKKWSPLRAAGIAFGNGAKARLAVHGCEKKGHSGSASASISVVQTHSS